MLYFFIAFISIYIFMRTVWYLQDKEEQAMIVHFEKRNKNKNTEFINA